MEALLMIRMNKEHWNDAVIQQVINKAASDRKRAIDETLAKKAHEDDSDDEVGEDDA